MPTGRAFLLPAGARRAEESATIHNLQPTAWLLPSPGVNQMLTFAGDGLLPCPSSPEASGHPESLPGQQSSVLHSRPPSMFYFELGRQAGAQQPREARVSSHEHNKAAP